MGRRRERFAFGRVLPLSGHRAFCVVIHGELSAQRRAYNDFDW
jgi:hypothetical protein